MTVWSNPDLEVAHNKGTIAIRPTGRLSPLRWVTKDRSEKCWVFGDVFETSALERFDHVRRGVLMGTHAEGLAFIAACEAAGIRVNNTGFFVPFSNGKPRSGTFEDGSPFTDYSEEELRMARVDGHVMTVQNFKAIVAEAA